jgi:hypothetical protein
MQLQKIHAVRFQAYQATVNLRCHLLRIPVVAIFIVAALGEQKVLIAPGTHRLADKLFAIDVALRRIDYIQTCVQRAIEQPAGCFKSNALVTDLGSSKAENGDIHAGFSESAFFHVP